MQCQNWAIRLQPKLISENQEIVWIAKLLQLDSLQLEAFSKKSLASKIEMNLKKNSTI